MTGVSPSAYVSAHLVKTACAGALFELGISTQQVSKLFDNIDALPKYLTVVAPLSIFHAVAVVLTIFPHLM